MNSEQWLPIVDYAVKTGVSTSTLRRYIKSNKIRFKIEGGRYLIWSDAVISQTMSDDRESDSLLRKARELEQRLEQSQEQVSELKMLVAIYEEKLSQKSANNA